MNATSLYVSACRSILRGAPGIGTLNQTLPNLRTLLGCPGCGKLTLDCCQTTTTSTTSSANSTNSNSDHNSTTTTDRDQEHINKRRLLTKAYSRLCFYFVRTDTFRQLAETRGNADSETLVELVREGADFADSQESPSASLSAGLYCDSSTQTSGPPMCSSSVPVSVPSSVVGGKPVANGGSSTYSVMYAGSGNKLTFKRKPPDNDDDANKFSVVAVEALGAKDNGGGVNTNQSGFKKPAYRSRNSSNKRKGCRCGNATATPGKLTCCGQRCPCYVESKPCTECKCKGCRNPHRADGMKVRPHIPQLDNIQLSMPLKRDSSPSSSISMETLDTDTFEITNMDQTITFDASDIKPSDIKVYTSQLQEVSADLPAAIMMDEDISLNSPGDSSSHMQERVSLTSPLTGAHHSLLVPVHNILIPFHRSSPGLSHQDNTSDIEVEV